MKRSSVIVIPIHKADPTDAELLSFAQCFKILHRHPIKVLAPRNLDLSRYRKLISEFDVIFIDPEWQSSLLQYNVLKRTIFFYKLFNSYDFLLTYELDAFVFKDDLDYWCNRGYDYIGAPWFDDWLLQGSTTITGVGNSGFSLRNMRAARKVLRGIRYSEVLIKYSNYITKSVIVRLPKIIYELYLAHKSMSEFEKNYDNHEDRFWCISAPAHLKKLSFTNPLIRLWASTLIKKEFKIAPVEDAAQFSFELNPRELYKLNNHTLPFGCHAWEKYDHDFWKPFIPQTVANENARL